MRTLLIRLRTQVHVAQPGRHGLLSADASYHILDIAGAVIWPAGTRNGVEQATAGEICPHFLAARIAVI
ncbi:MAG: hypothetical protein AMJ65_04940 [Phycisphaerae bacterium SG8_4]|nr:MAG: hypothetical protein AMJ65_04940 [Phycisphaerae bacterium SG8_4]